MYMFRECFWMNSVDVKGLGRDFDPGPISEDSIDCPAALRLVSAGWGSECHR